MAKAVTLSARWAVMAWLPAFAATRQRQMIAALKKRGTFSSLNGQNL
jgi:hypothetical protein